MKSRHVSMFMMTVTLAYGAPVEYDTVDLATPNKLELRQADDTPGKCCSSLSQRCCPYDYDDRCETTNNRTLCGYNKNKKNTDNTIFSFTKYGLPCRINDDRLECGYNGPYITDITDPLPNTSAGNPSGCCNCCNEQTTKAAITTEATIVTITEPAIEHLESTTSRPEPSETVTEITEFIPETRQSRTETTETRTETTDSYEYSEESTRTSYQKLNIKTTEPTTGSMEPTPPATTCVTVEEKCHIEYEQPCIMDPPCQRDYID